MNTDWFFWYIWNRTCCRRSYFVPIQSFDPNNDIYGNSLTQIYKTHSNAWTNRHSLINTHYKHTDSTRYIHRFTCWWLTSSPRYAPDVDAIYSHRARRHQSCIHVLLWNVFIMGFSYGYMYLRTSTMRSIIGWKHNTLYVNSHCFMLWQDNPWYIKKKQML